MKFLIVLTQLGAAVVRE